MATLLSKATGLFTAASTWGVASAVAGAELDSIANSINLSTGNSDSGTFVPAATAIDAVAIRISNIITPTGTLTVILRNSTAGTDARTVTINVSDLLATNAAGWHVFSFASLTPNGTDSYLIRVTRSVADGGTNRITLNCSTAAAANMARQVRLTTTGAPASGDKLIIAGEFTGAGASTSYTVTMDNTATTSFGPTVSGGPPEGITVNNKSTLTWQNTAATAYYLKWKGLLAVFGGGTVNVGTSGSPINAAGTTAVLEMDSAANVDTGIDVRSGGTFNAYGATKAVTQTLMTADKAAAATTLAVASTSGWAVGDELGIASTTQTATQCEKKTILTVDSGVQVTLTAGLTNAHSGTAPIQAEVINLTRNVKVRGISTSLQGYIVIQTGGIFASQYTEYLQLGSATANKEGITCLTTTGSCNIQFCSIHDFIVANSVGFYCNNAAWNNVTFSNNVSYNIHIRHIILILTTGTNWTVSGNVMILNVSGNMCNVLDLGGTFTNNTAAGSVSHGILIQENSPVTGTVSGLTAHSCGANGILVNWIAGGTVGAITAWRNVSFGLAIQSGSFSNRSTTFASVIAFGNATGGIDLGGGANAGITITSPTLNGDTTFAQPAGIKMDQSGGVSADIFVENGDFGTVSGIKTTHSTGDFVISVNQYATIVFRNCKFASATEFSGQANLQPGSYVRSQKHDQTVGLHKAWFPYGTFDTDAAVFRTAAPSLKMTPNSGSNKLETERKRGAVASGGTLTFTAYVQKSAAYNGNQPRLVLKKNVAAGIAADTVLATAVGGTGSFLTLTGVTTPAVTDNAILEVVVDCDGTVGFVNVDDWAVSA